MPTTYHWLSEQRPVTDISPWDSVLGRYKRLVGYTSFGDFFVIDPLTSEHGILLPFHRMVEGTGCFSRAEFIQRFLTLPDIVNQILQPELLETLQRRLGPLGPYEVYYPVPYPSIGGSGTPETYEKGDVWVFASVTGQSYGLLSQR